MESQPTSKSQTKLKLEHVDDIKRWTFEILEGPIFESPIDINIGQAFDVDLPPLKWHNFDLVPKKMKLTNSGQTIILSGKWYQERPYLTGGPLVGNYVFSQLHLHWGANDMEGSEHTVNGKAFPLEVHVIFFRSCYLMQEAALKERDGVIALVYFFQLHDASSSTVEYIIKNLENVKKPFTSVKLNPFALPSLIPTFSQDYFAYWGSLSATHCKHFIVWIICRQPYGLTSNQIGTIRTVLGLDTKPVTRNYRNTQPFNKRTLFLVCSCGSKNQTLLPIKKS